MSAHGDVATGPGWELRCGDYRDVLADVERVDAVITDPPYGERTHAGNRGMAERIGGDRRDLEYSHWTGLDVDELYAEWSSRCCGWICAMTSHDLIPDYERAARERGRYAFAPVPIIQPRVRLGGDGPASCTVYLMVSRPREKRFLSWGALPGWYRASIDRSGIQGGKPLDLMRALVRDYSRPGDLICDPCAGGGTTLLAAVTEGRRAIGAELDPATFGLAVARLRGGDTPPLIAA